MHSATAWRPSHGNVARRELGGADVVSTGTRKANTHSDRAERHHALQSTRVRRRLDRRRDVARRAHAWRLLSTLQGQERALRGGRRALTQRDTMVTLGWSERGFLAARRGGAGRARLFVEATPRRRRRELPDGRAAERRRSQRPSGQGGVRKRIPSHGRALRRNPPQG